VKRLFRWCSCLQIACRNAQVAGSLWNKAIGQLGVRRTKWPARPSCKCCGGERKGRGHQLEQGYFVDLGEGRSKLRWLRHSESQIRFEAVRPGSNSIMDVATFVCDTPEFVSLCEGGVLSITSDQGSFIARTAGDSIWVVFQIDPWQYQDSCLVPRESFGQLAVRTDNPQSSASAY
jgi:hypothetical protein